VLTILSAFASDKKTLSSAFPTDGSSFVSPKDLLVTSAIVPIPSPAAKPPNDAMRAIRDDGTFLCLAVALSCKDSIIIIIIIIINLFNPIRHTHDSGYINFNINIIYRTKTTIKPQKH
jgi:hypothetical protein